VPHPSPVFGEGWAGDTLRGAMPKGLKRYYGRGHLHFITSSCYRRSPMLGTARRRDLFVRLLEQVRIEYQFDIFGYVVMPEHFHILMSEPAKVIRPS
jgi:putative transposase